MLEKILASNLTEAEVIVFVILDLEEVLLRTKVTEMSTSEQEGKDFAINIETKVNAQN